MRYENDYNKLHINISKGMALLLQGLAFIILVPKAALASPKKEKQSLVHMIKCCILILNIWKSVWEKKISDIPHNSHVADDGSLVGRQRKYHR